MRQDLRLIDKVARSGRCLNIHCARLGTDHESLSSWPDREELLIEFTRLLGAAQEGGAAVAKCLSADRSF
jgi:hypothetical protein